MIARNAASAGSAVTRLAGGPLIGRRAAQRLARHELAETSTWQRIWQWLARLPGTAGNIVPGGWFGLIALAILAILTITIIIFWARPARTGRAAAGSVLGGAPSTARDYRRAAERLAAAGDYAGAIVECVRAIAAELDERGVLSPRPGRTADELAAEAGGELPGLAGDLRTVTRLFDDIRYGDREGSQAGYLLVSRLDRQVRAARAAAAPGPSLRPGRAGGTAVTAPSLRAASDADRAGLTSGQAARDPASATAAAGAHGAAGAAGQPGQPGPTASRPPAPAPAGGAGGCRWP